MDSRSPDLGPWPAGTLLGDLSLEARDKLLRLGTVRQVEAKRVLLNQGERSTHVLLVLHGWVKVVARNEGGDLALLAIRTSGEFVGEQAGLDDQPRSATVETASLSWVAIVEMRNFVRFLCSDEEAVLAVLRGLSAMIRSATRRRVNFIGRDAMSRLALVLDELVESYGRATHDGVRIQVSLTYQDLAGLVETSERTVQRTMPELERQGILRSHRGRITVLDRQRLRDVIEHPDKGP